MLRAYKTEIKPTSKQKIKIHKTIGVCRYIYNFYLSHNQEVYQKEKRFVSGMAFSKWINNEFIPNNEDHLWIKEVSSKAVKKSIMNGDKAFRRFFKGESNFPKFKKKAKSDVKAYFPKNNETDWPVERHRVKIPTLGWVRLKEFGYIPTKWKVKSGTVSMQAGRYYVSVLIDINNKAVTTKSEFKPLGVDLGLKEFATTSNEVVYKNINKTTKIKKLEKNLKENSEVFQGNMRT